MARITVEDCLKKEHNRFSLVFLAAKRAKQLLSGQQTVTDSRGNKAIVTALREIAAGKVKFKTPYIPKGSVVIESDSAVDEQSIGGQTH